MFEALLAELEELLSSAVDSGDTVAIDAYRDAVVLFRGMVLDAATCRRGDGYEAFRAVMESSRAHADLRGRAAESRAFNDIIMTMELTFL